MIERKVSEFFLKLFQTIYSLIKIMLLSKYFVRLKDKNIQVKECVILANGPSLKKDLEKNFKFILDKKKFCVNFFALSEEYEKLKPDYCVLSAPEFWLSGPSEYFKKLRNELINALMLKTNWHLTLLIPFKSRNSTFVKAIKQNSNIDIKYYNNTPIEGFQGIVNWIFKFNLGVPRPHNVLIPTLVLAINTGFKNIYLFGADHSWHEEIKVDDFNETSVNHEHFYDKSEVRMPMYKLDGEKYHIHDIFRKLHFAFKGYFIIKNYADYLGVKIFNASSKSYIDAFPRVKL